MRRRVTQRALLSKGNARKNPRGTNLGPRGATTLYQIAASKGGVARVCVIRKVGGIGDVLMCTPALRQLKAEFPELHLTFAIDMHTTGNNVYWELVRNAPFLDSIVDARYVDKSKFDGTVDISAVCLRFERAGLPPINRVDLFGRAIGLRRIRHKRSWYEVTPDEERWASRYRGEEKLVVLHTASMEEKRCWPIEKYLELVTESESRGLPIRFLVLDFNKKYRHWDAHSNVIDVSDTGLRQMAAIIAEADLFIGPDSGPMHLAGAVSTKSIVLFGSVPPEARINYYPTHAAMVVEGLSCLGCWYKPCGIGMKCMKDLDSALIRHKMVRLLDEV